MSGGASITTVIPTYRRPHLLRRSIESVLGQNYDNSRVVVFDNASGDETSDVVADLARRDGRVRYVRNDQNIGAVRNIRKAVDSIDTDFWTLLSDDDFLLPGFFNNAIVAFYDHPSAQFVCGTTVMLDQRSRRLRSWPVGWLPGRYEPAPATTSKMNRSHFVQTAVVLRRDFRAAIGNFEGMGNDRIHMTIASAAGPFVVLPEAVAAFNVHEGTATTTGALAKAPKEVILSAMLESVEKISHLRCDANTKGHLLYRVVRDYGALIGHQALTLRDSKTWPRSEWVISPRRGFDAVEHSVVLRPMLAAAHQLSAVREKYRNRMGGIPMPQRLYELLNSNAEFSIILECLQQSIRTLDRE